MVLDADRLNAVAEGLRRRHNPMPIAAIERYWASAITLSDYRRLYDQSNGVLLDRLSDDTHLPFYRVPEVLIPGPVSPEKVSWIASILGKKSVELSAK